MAYFFLYLWIWLVGAIIMYRIIRAALREPNSEWNVADRARACTLAAISWPGLLLVAIALLFKDNDKPAKW